MITMEAIEKPMVLGKVLSPGLPILPAGMERHPVPGGGSRAVPINVGDEITVMDREGLQPCEIVVFSSDGRSDTGLIGAENDGPPEGLKAILGSDEPSALFSARVLGK